MRIIAFDTETTGVKPETDRIVELTLVDANGTTSGFRVNPGVPIPPEATRVHGITDADVKHAPRFADVAEEIQRLVSGAVLLGYNSRNFDTLILHAELQRAGRPGLDLDALKEIDVYRLWLELEPRTLTGAVRRWLSTDHANAHSARADVEATLRVWNAIKQHAGIDEARAIELSRPRDEIDRAGKFRLDETGHVTLTFGKYAGVPSKKIDPSYFQWILNSDFPASTKGVVLRLIANDFDLPEAARFRQTLARSQTERAAP